MQTEPPQASSGRHPPEGGQQPWGGPAAADSSGPVGVFDSGVGGLSVWREIRRALPSESTCYFADQIHVPYGPRPVDELRALSEGITRFFFEHGCKTVVVACNTASAAALKHLRDTFPGVPIIGMEPAVKPAAALTQSGVVGVMATPATFQGRLFQATVGRHAAHVRLINQVCDGLAEQVESGVLDGPEASALLNRFLDPILAAGADTVVLACTHYAFLLDAIARRCGPDVTVIDPAPAIARHLGDRLAAAHLLASAGHQPVHTFFTTGPGPAFDALASRLVATPIRSIRATWGDGHVMVDRPELQADSRAA